MPDLYHMRCLPPLYASSRMTEPYTVAIPGSQGSVGQRRGLLSCLRGWWTARLRLVVEAMRWSSRKSWRVESMRMGSAARLEAMRSVRRRWCRMDVLNHGEGWEHSGRMGFINSAGAGSA